MCKWRILFSVVFTGLLLSACGKRNSALYYTLDDEKYEILETNICNTTPKPVEENELLCQYLAEQLENGRAMVELGVSFFEAEYFTYDFNDDGKDDYLVSLCGAGFHSANGNLTYIFLQEDEGLRRVFHVTLSFAYSGEDGGYAPVMVLSEKVNGVHSIVFSGYDRIWKYDEQEDRYVSEP